MTPILIALALFTRTSETEPEPHTFYAQAVGCAAAASLEPERDDQSDEALADELLGWGMVVAQLGPTLGRTRDQVDREDIARAVTFFAQMQTTRPDAFRAHRAYCRTLMQPRSDAG